MKGAKNRRDFIFNLFLILAAVAVTSIAVATGAYVRDGLESGELLAVGAVSPQKLKATKDVVNVVATERNKEEARLDAMEMKPIRKKDVAVNEKILKNLAAFTSKLDEIRFVYAQEQEALVNAAQVEPQPAAPSADPDSGGADDGGEDVLAAESGEGGASAGEVEPTPPTLPKTETGAPLMPPSPLEQLHLLQVTFSDAQAKLLLSMDEEHYEKLEAAVIQVLDEVLEQGVQEIDAKSLLSIQDAFSKIDLSGEMIGIGYQIASAFLQPNHVIDHEATTKAREEIASQYKEVRLKKGQTIVDEGDIVSEEAYAILVELGLVSTGIVDKIPAIINVVAVNLLLLALLVAFICSACRDSFKSRKQSALLFTITISVIIIIRLLDAVPYQLMPIFISTMLVSMLISAQ
jgi:membrane-associated HD superfamily phosphohydrolase